MSIRSKTNDKARSIPYLDGAAIEQLSCLFNGRLIVRALDDLGRLLDVVVLTEEEDSIRPHHARPRQCLNLRVARDEIFMRRVSHEDVQKNAALNPKTRCGCCARH